MGILDTAVMESDWEEDPESREHHDAKRVRCRRGSSRSGVPKELFSLVFRHEDAYEYVLFEKKFAEKTRVCLKTEKDETLDITVEEALEMLEQDGGENPTPLVNQLLTLFRVPMENMENWYRIGESGQSDFIDTLSITYPYLMIWNSVAFGCDWAGQMFPVFDKEEGNEQISKTFICYM